VTFSCWWCGKPLCATCGDRDGHCGHADADTVNEASARATTYADRARIVERLKDAGFTLGRAREMLALPLPRPKGKPN
jgi:hypothetical protein